MYHAFDHKPWKDWKRTFGWGFERMQGEMDHWKLSVEEKGSGIICLRVVGSGVYVCTHDGRTIGDVL